MALSNLLNKCYHLGGYINYTFFPIFIDASLSIIRPLYHINNFVSVCPSRHMRMMMGEKQH